MRIEDLTLGEYRRSAEGTEPSYLVTPWNERINRARIMGTVVDKFMRDDKSYATMRLDDGSATIRVRAWGSDTSQLESFKIGDIVDVIGRVREFEGEVYLTPEIMLTVEDPNWELVRELEIIGPRRDMLARGLRPRLPQRLEPGSLAVEISTPSKPALSDEEKLPPLPEVHDEKKDRVFGALKEIQGADGVQLGALISKTGLQEQEVVEAMKSLFSEGKIFEPRAGKFKLVE